MDKPEALRLADNIEAGYYGHCPQAAAELRRLSAENKLLHQRHHDDNVEYTRVLAQRDALLEALEKYRKMMFVEAGCRFGEGDAAITALRAALVQEQATMTADDLAESISRGEKWKVIGCIGHDCEECQTRIAKDASQQAEPVKPAPAAIVATQSDVWRGYNGQWAPPGEHHQNGADAA